jgi:mannose-6-phosphate isomerase-like protein (cupin superfamily)
MESFTAGETLAHLAQEKSDFVRLLEKQGFDLSFYRPIGTDTQTPHQRDEIYVVASGSGLFVSEGKSTPFGPGDAIFVEAGKAHCFEGFTPDFSTWVIFIGKRP